MPGPYRVIIPLISTLLKKGGSHHAQPPSRRHSPRRAPAHRLRVRHGYDTPDHPPRPNPPLPPPRPPAAGDFAWLNRHDSSFNSGDAYYEMVYRNHGGLLLKTDYATAAQTVACTVPGCTHDSADCPAWFPGRYRYLLPFVADARSMCSTRRYSTPDRTWEEYREEYLTPQLDSTDLTPEELEAHYYGLWQAAKRRAAGGQADRRRQDLHRPARRVCGLRV